MGLLKGKDNAGWLEIDRNIRFMKGVDLSIAWNDEFYVDYDDGLDTYAGRSTRTPYKNLATALTAMSAWGTCYVRPRDPDSTGGDPNAITPATAANWAIPYTKHGISIIGAGIGIPGAASAYQTRLQGHASVTATPTLDIKAPFCNVENIGFRRGGSTSGQVWLKTDADTRYSFASTLYKCHFRLGQAVGAVVIDSAWYTRLVGCTFSSCAVGILIAAGQSVPVGLVVDDCDFEGLTTEIDADILTSGAVTRILMKRLYFNHALPALSGGSHLKYIKAGAASTGLVADSFFGVADATIANSLTLNGITNSHLWGMSAEIT